MREQRPEDAPPPGDAPDAGGDDALEALVGRALEHLEGGDLDGFQALLSEQPEQAERVRQRLAALERLGLLAAPQRSLAPERLGRYRVLEKLGEGGMSVVYLAQDELLERRVAIKIARVPLSGGERTRERFRREVRAASSVRHPCLVPIHDAGEDEGRAWFAMECVEGATLASVLEQLREFGRRPGELGVADLERALDRAGGPAGGGPASLASKSYVEAVCRIVIDAADALTALHTAGIVHRDVKPSNVLLRPDGRALLFDLGLAHLEDLPSLTRTGEFAGTPAYVAPEEIQYGALAASAQSDVYSLGVSLYELLTLRRPFEGPSTVELWRRTLRSEPPLPRRFHPELARDLETVVLVALEKDPRRRYASAAALAADLRRVLEYQQVEARAASRLRRGLRILRRDPALAAATGLGLAIFLALPIGLLWANAAIRAQRDRATFQLHVNEEVLDFVVDLFRPPAGEGHTGEGARIAREFLDRGVERLRLGFGDKMEERAALMEVLGRFYGGLGESEQALPLLDRALAAVLRTQGEGSPESLRITSELARVHLASGNAPAARALGEQVLRWTEDEPERNLPERFASLYVVGLAALEQGDLDRAEACLAEALLVRDSAPGGSELDALLLHGLADLARERGDVELEQSYLERAFAMSRAEWEPDPRRLAALLERLAQVLERRGKLAEARSARAELALLRAAPTGAEASPLPDLGGFLAPEPEWRASYRASFQRGITALQAHDSAAALAAFQDCLRLDPSSSVCAYNCACATALAGDVGETARWLDLACRTGFAQGPGRLEALEADPDLARLRGEPAIEREIRRMREGRRAALDYASTASSWSPPASGAESRPLLVVLHRDGARREDVLGGSFGRLCAGLGWHLLAPSARRGRGEGIEQGLVWSADPSEGAPDHWDYEPFLLNEVRTFAREHAVDPERIWIAGEGLGGLVALELALHAPGLFRGVLLCDAPLPVEIDRERARTASALGTKLAYLAHLGEGIPGLRAGLRAEELTPVVQAWLVALGFARHARTAIADGPWPGAGEREREIRDCLRGFAGN